MDLQDNMLNIRNIFLSGQVALLLAASNAACAIELDQAANLAKLSTVFLWIDYVDCDANVAKKASASGFIVSNEGHVVTAAHTFRSQTSGCEHSIRSIKGTNVRETASVNAGDVGQDLNLLSKDFNADLASLRFTAGIPKGAQPHWVCSDKSPQAGEIFYAFGFPEGKPLTPLPITFSRVDIRNGFWIVSGLTTFGMSGGPVFDRFGNIVGSIQGGLVAGQEQVLAVRYVAPLKDLLNIVPQGTVLKNCGFFPVRPIAGVGEHLETLKTDTVSCGAGIASGFMATKINDGSTLLIWPAFARSAVSSPGLIASRFRVLVQKLALTQYGVDAPDFDGTKDLLGCLAASAWIDQPGRNLFADADFAHIKVIEKLLSVGDTVTALTYEQCFSKSSLRGSALGGLTVESSSQVSMVVDDAGEEFHRIGRTRLDFTKAKSEFIGSLMYFAAEKKLSALVGDATGNLLANRLVGIFRGKSAHSVSGILATCKAYDNIEYKDFKKICESVVQRAVFRGIDIAGSCLKETSY